VNKRVAQKFILFILCLNLFLISFITVTAQVSVYPKNSPEWLVDMFFVQNNFREKAKFFIGEMMQDVNYPTVGEELNGRASVIFRKIEQNSGTGVYGVVIRDNGNTANFYCYVRNISGNWKIEAVRKFQLPKFVYNVRDSLTWISKLSDSSSSLLKTLKLVTGTDEELKQFLSDNINDFYNTVGAFQKERGENLKLLMNKLNMNYIFMDKNYSQCIFILVGGFDGTEVGYIFCNNKLSVPKISQERFIYLEEVLPNWYVYRAM